MITRVTPIALLLLVAIGPASAQGGQPDSRKAAVQPARPSAALPISSVVPKGADSAKAINKHLASHPKQKASANLRASKKSRAMSMARSSSDSSRIAPLPTVKPRTKPSSGERPPQR